MEGKFNFESSDNFDKFLEALGVGFVTRKTASALKPTVEISIAGDEYTIKSLSSLKNTEIKFKLGQEFEEDRADGKKVKTVVTKEGDNKLVQIQDPAGAKQVTITREFSGDLLTVTAEVSGVKSVRTYKRA